MVSGKVKQAMRLHKSPKPHIHQHSPTYSSSSGFSRYFPASSSSQVQPKHPNIFEVLCLVDHLRERMSQLLQLKLINESSAVETASRNSQVSALSAKLQDLERNNELIRRELDDVRLGGEAEKEESEWRIGELQARREGPALSCELQLSHVLKT